MYACMHASCAYTHIMQARMSCMHTYHVGMHVVHTSHACMIFLYEMHMNYFYIKLHLDIYNFTHEKLV
jgi:hypothetical protein